MDPPNLILRATRNPLAIAVFSIGGVGASAMWNPFTFRSLEGLPFGLRAAAVFAAVGFIAWVAGWNLEGPRLSFALLASNLTTLLSMAAVRSVVGWRYDFGPADALGLIALARKEPGASAVIPSLCIFLASAAVGVITAHLLRDHDLHGVAGLSAVAGATSSFVGGVGFFVGALIDPVSGPSLVQDGGATTGMLLGALVGIYVWKSKLRPAEAIAAVGQASTSGAMSRQQIRDALRATSGRLVRLRLNDGRSLTARIENIDDDNFTYRVVDHCDFDPTIRWRSRYDDFAEALPL